MPKKSFESKLFSMKKLYFVIPILFLLASCEPSDEEIAQQRKLIAQEAQERKHKRLMALYGCRTYASSRCTYTSTSCFDITVRLCMSDEGYFDVKMKEADPFIIPQ